MFIHHNFKRRALTAALLFAPLALALANTTQEVERVTGTVSLSSPTDYVVTSPTPFATGAVVDIADTEHAVLILKHVKPSVAGSLLSHVRIGGQAAVAGTNCQVRIYANGSIVMPYAKTVKPLTVYTGLDQTGDAAQFAAGSRQSLGGQPVNNRIRSFRLKRGYMVTFATKSDGKGYSRVFIADGADLAVNLPPILDNSVSSLRVMQWNDVSKRGYAGRDNTVNTALNTTWCYNWDAGNDNYADREFVTQRHHEAGIKNGKYEGAWPSVPDCGNNGSSPHILGQNEPDNTGDPREVVTKIEDLLAVWPELMATGKRLGSPAMSGNLNMLYQFLDSIDARGWRCDFVAVHSYWYSDWGSWLWNFNNIHNRTGRPLWITEMNYGANWTGWPAGSDRSGSASNLAIEKQHMAPILDGLESTGYVERYAFYNHVQDCRAAYLNGSLTPIGEYYANLESGLAYNSAHAYVPRLPASKGAPRDLEVKFNSQTGTAALAWHEPTGEYNQSMTVERRRGSEGWQVVATVALQEDGADYTQTLADTRDGDQLRIHVVYADGKDYYSKTVAAVPSQLAAGDAVTVDGATRYVGGNLLVNGDFELGTAGWTNGEGHELGQPHFEVFPMGGYEGAYLQAFSNTATETAGAVKTFVTLEPNADYYCAAATRFDGVTYNHFALTADGTTEAQVPLSLAASTTWSKQAATFNSGSYTRGMFSFRRLGGKAQFDQLQLSRLYATRQEALADGLACTRQRAAAVAQACATALPQLAEWLKAEAQAHAEASSEDIAAIAAAARQTLAALRLKPRADSLLALAQVALAEQLPGHETVAAARQALEQPSSAEAYAQATAALKQAVEACLPFVATDRVAKGDFAGETAYGWDVKTGTYTGGTQAAATVAGKTCWSALWTGVPASAGTSQTMAIGQRITGVPHGLYMLTCKAAAQHYTLSDQHAYLRTRTDSMVSPKLSSDWLDMPMVADADKWQTLATVPVYVAEGDTLTVGFASSKLGATDYAWREYGNATSTGDRREGSWAATDFVLCHLPVYHTTVDASGWSTLCLPYKAQPTQGVRFYRIAGLTADSSRVCLEPIAETEAGVPCVVHSDHPDVVITESGQAVTRPGTGDNNLRGMLKTTARAPQHSLTLVNGIWVDQDNADRNKRPYLADFQAFITKLDGMTVLEGWTGESLPITTATGVRGITTTADGAETYFTLDGRRVSDVSHLGVYIRVKDGKAVKVVRSR